MNVLDCIKVKKDFYCFCFEPEELSLSTIEIASLPSLVSELINWSVVSVSPKNRVGKVLVFDVIPYKSIDPPLIFCKGIDLSRYYLIWNIVIIDKGRSWDRKLVLQEFDEMLRELNISSLTREESSFLIFNLLNFKNEYIRRM